MHRYIMFSRIVASSLVRRRSRILVALLAVAIGATVFLGMGAIYYDIPRQMGREFRSYGANLVLLPSGGGDALDLEDAAAATALLPADQVVGISAFRYETVYYNMQGLTAVGTDFSAVRKTSPYWQVQGAWPQDGDSVLIGVDVAEQTRLYPGSAMSLEIVPPGGRRLKKDVLVSGLVRSGGPEDACVLMTLEGMERLFDRSGGRRTANVVEISIAAPGPELERFARDMHERVPALTARLVKRIADSETTVLARLQVLVYLVTSIVLVLTMICVGTTMLTVVMERRREIGLKKAIGATNGAIIAEFMGEGITLALIGGLAGVGFGYFFAQAVSLSVFGREVDLPFFMVGLTLAASMLVTVVASLIPAARAADVDPAIVLRGE